MSKQYVVYFCEHLFFAVPEGARVVSSLDAALKLINKIANGYAGGNYSFRLFELGKEIPIEQGVIEEPQPPKTQTEFKLVDQDPNTGREVSRGEFVQRRSVRRAR